LADRDPDRGLIEKIRTGDIEAYKELITRYWKPLLKFAYRHLGDAWAAEDAVQETFLKVYKALPEYEPRPEARFSTWLFRIAYRVCLNELTARKRYSIRLTEIAREARIDEAAKPDERAAGVRDFMAEALGKIPERQRAALLLRVNEGLTYDEIGEVLGLTRSAVESLIFRARSGLRRLLDGEGSDDDVS
jgi:RNA polymerase sigma-70 factor (ECF subfamily)